jgi:hypothetical protein
VPTDDVVYKCWVARLYLLQKPPLKTAGPVGRSVLSLFVEIASAVSIYCGHHHECASAEAKQAKNVYTQQPELLLFIF